MRSGCWDSRTWDCALDAFCLSSVSADSHRACFSESDGHTCVVWSKENEVWLSAS